MRRFFAVALCLAGMLAPALALETGADQFAMGKRVEAAVSAYAKQLGLSDTWTWYCRLEMYRKLSSHPRDGSIPFGFNYTTATDQSTVNLAIASREAFERSDQMLCLANIKNALREAQKPF